MLQFIGQKKCVCVWGGRGVKGYGALYATSLCSCFGLSEIGLCMVFNATFNNISVISWWSVLLVEETRVPGDNHRPVASHIMLYRVHLG